MIANTSVNSAIQKVMTEKAIHSKPPSSVILSVNVSIIQLSNVLFSMEHAFLNLLQLSYQGKPSMHTDLLCWVLQWLNHASMRVTSVESYVGIPQSSAGECPGECTGKPCTATWFRWLPPEYHLIATEMENPVVFYTLIIITWYRSRLVPQMYSN